ncbi:metal ABC transporter substrate-binding protein [Desulfitobacterium sp.]|uniref:metal ABC transporter substrate-binding protein n=1 Tax=Desulfitobacterium sp. TaxID=49981 RepID=UPI002B2152AE|nr:metal ABC transporter substrate-binding protein [Desulfitobacterium sp.]MEA4901377.1 metal ABC transporter substrate-binding protein [Desulfitobacterium sp.]
MKRIKVGLIIGLLLSALVITGCGAINSTTNSLGTGSASDTDHKLTVYTSVYPMYDFTQKIAGDKIILKNLVPAGTEPHEWEPTPSDIADLEKADVLIYNGAGMEPWLDKVLNSINPEKLKTVEASKEVKLLNNTDGAKNKGTDPHVWLDPMSAKVEMGAIKDALVSIDPANKDYYEKNYEDNAAQLDQLDQEYKSAVAQFSKKDIVVAHQAFSYLCNAYGLNQVAIEGISADSEPSPARMAEIVEFAREKQLKYIFFEELVSPKVAQTIAQETGAATAVLNPFEGSTDSGQQAGKDYFSVMRDNLKVLKQALQ